MNVVEDEQYIFVGTSSVDIDAFIYTKSFDPIRANNNQQFRDNHCNHKGKFQLIAYLQKDTTYILVVTTLKPNITGNFSIAVFGRYIVTLKHISE